MGLQPPPEVSEIFYLKTKCCIQNISQLLLENIKSYIKPPTLITIMKIKKKQLCIRFGATVSGVRSNFFRVGWIFWGPNTILGRLFRGDWGANPPSENSEYMGKLKIFQINFRKNLKNRMLFVKNNANFSQTFIEKCTKNNKINIPAARRGVGGLKGRASQTLAKFRKCLLKLLRKNRIICKKLSKFVELFIKN